MFKLWHNFTHLTHEQSNAQNSPIQSSTVCELGTSDIQAGLKKGRGTRDQIANIYWIIEKAREFQKIIYFCFIDDTKAFDCVDHNKLWKILQAMRIPDHLTCLLRNAYVGQEAVVRTGYRTMNWFQIRKGVCQGYILSPCLFNLYAEYIMWNEWNFILVWTLFVIALLGIGMKTDLFQFSVHAEFSIFAGILSAALSLHHLLGFEIGQLEFHHIH